METLSLIVPVLLNKYRTTIHGQEVEVKVYSPGPSENLPKYVGELEDEAHEDSYAEPIDDAYDFITDEANLWRAIHEEEDEEEEAEYQGLP